MDEALHATHIALHQRFDALKTQIHEIHTAWQQAVAVKDFPRQKALIAQERALFAEVHTVMEAFKASIAQLHAAEEDRGSR